jgi:hypothetical protein
MGSSTKLRQRIKDLTQSREAAEIGMEVTEVKSIRKISRGAASFFIQLTARSATLRLCVSSLLDVDGRAIGIHRQCAIHPSGLPSAYPEQANFPTTST